ncbi:MAG: aminodeoxychorismate lyase [Alphaproteobacteria bacterium]
MTKAIPDLLVNGLPAGAVPADDRGLRYGDGVFETIAVRDGKPEFWERHRRRLQRGAERLGIEAPAEATLIGEARALLATPRDGVLRIWLTRGSGGEGYRPAASQRPTRILRLDPFPAHPEAAKTKGVSVRLAKTRLGRNPALAGIKHLNRLEQVLAANEERNPEIAEALMADDAGNLIEGTRTNVFFVIEGVLTTPDLSGAGVAGILREVVLEEAKSMGREVSVRPVRPEEAKKAEEFFLTNSLIHLWPVRQFEKRTYDIGTYTRELAERIGRRASREHGLPSLPA